MRWVIYAIAVTLVAGFPAIAAATTLFTADASSQGFYEWDTGSGATSLIGTTGSGGIQGLAYDPVTGTLFATSFDSLLSIDPATGQGTIIGSFGAGITGSESLAADANGNLFTVALSTDRLYRLDKTTGAATDIGATRGGITAMTFAADGTLYAASAGLRGATTNALLTIDVSTGAATQQVLTNRALFGLAFGPDGTLFGAVSLDDQLSTVDPATGVVTQYGPLTPFPSPNSLAYVGDIFDDGTVVSTPATITMMSAALLLLSCYRPNRSNTSSTLSIVSALRSIRSSV